MLADVFLAPVGSDMETACQSKQNNESINDLAGFFDLLAKFDFEDAKKHRASTTTQEVEKGSSLAGGEPFPESCESGLITMSEEPSFKSREAKHSSYKGLEDLAQTQD